MASRSTRRLARYLRYSIGLDAAKLAKIGVDLHPHEILALQKFSNANAGLDPLEVGSQVWRREMSGYFPVPFDLDAGL